MHALDPLSHCTEMTSYLNKLIDIDPMRTNYYNDLRKNYCLVCNKIKHGFRIYAKKRSLKIEIIGNVHIENSKNSAFS